MVNLILIYQKLGETPLPKDEKISLLITCKAEQSLYVMDTVQLRDK